MKQLGKVGDYTVCVGEDTAGDQWEWAVYFKDGYEWGNTPENCGTEEDWATAVESGLESARFYNEFHG